jgi:hypothetical protein
MRSEEYHSDFPGTPLYTDTYGNGHRSYTKFAARFSAG